MDFSFRKYPQGEHGYAHISALFPLKLTLRAGIRSAFAPDDFKAWMVTYIVIDGPLFVPYRFFYVWLRKQGGWKIILPTMLLALTLLIQGSLSMKNSRYTDFLVGFA